MKLRNIQQLMIRHVGIHMALGIFFLAPLFSAHADVPRFFSYQGLVTDENGEPATGSITVRIELYDSPEDGTQLYCEDHRDVPLDAGVYSLHVGNGDVDCGDPPLENPGFSDETLSLLRSTSEVWLAEFINGNPLTPRARIGANLFALKALTSETTEGLAVPGDPNDVRLKVDFHSEAGPARITIGEDTEKWTNLRHFGSMFMNGNQGQVLLDLTSNKRFKARSRPNCGKQNSTAWL